MNPVIVWFRRDLRLYDNPALSWAAAKGVRILPVYVHSPDEEAPWTPGGASRWWLHHSLLELRDNLAGQGLILRCFRGNAAEIIPRLVRGLRAQALTLNRLYEPHLAERDQGIFQELAALRTEIQAFDSALFNVPGSVLNGQQQPYRVFTPFWRKVRQMLEVCPPGPPAALTGTMLPAWQEPPEGAVDVAALGLLDSHPWYEKLHDYWQPGEQGALRRLDHFCISGLEDYRQAREFPAQPGSSRLSPHLHFGEITPAQIWHRLMQNRYELQPAAGASMETFLKELGWREFAHQVMWHFPHTSERSMNPRFRDDFWERHDAALRNWQRGRTGIPLVDAGMRELWATGWMHNRVRMIVGSFLTKNLGIHWREGARWFWDTLVDADLANNSLGWQWVAGCGVDAAPYYRIFNPQTQAKRFDPRGEYLQRWLGDLEISTPIVDLAASRGRALARYAEL